MATASSREPRCHGIDRRTAWLLVAPVMSPGRVGIDDRLLGELREYVIEVRPPVLLESDGPMLVVGLQQINGRQIHLPRRPIDLPDRARLEGRYEQFRQAAG